PGYRPEGLLGRGPLGGPAAGRGGRLRRHSRVPRRARGGGQARPEVRRVHAGDRGGHAGSGTRGRGRRPGGTPTHRLPDPAPGGRRGAEPGAAGPGGAGAGRSGREAAGGGGNGTRSARARLARLRPGDAAAPRERLLAGDSQGGVPGAGGPASRLIPYKADDTGRCESIPRRPGTGGQSPSRPRSCTHQVSETTAATEAPTKHPKLISWVKQIAELTQPDSIHWCDGSAEEYDALAQGLVDAGTFEKLSDAKRPNSYLARSNPSDVARVDDRTFICSPREEDAGPTNNW